MSPLRLVLALTLCLLCPLSTPAQEKPAYPDSAAGLKSMMTDLYTAAKDGDQKKTDALVKSLALPKHEAWFKEVFGADKGAKVAAEYAKVLPMFAADIEKLLAKLVKEGQSEIAVLRFEKAPDPKAVGLQNDALAAMKKPVPIYSVRFVKPGEKLGQHVYSFVYVDGGFRLVGKMTGFKD